MAVFLHKMRWCFPPGSPPAAPWSVPVHGWELVSAAEEASGAFTGLTWPSKWWACSWRGNFYQSWRFWSWWESSCQSPWRTRPDEAKRKKSLLQHGESPQEQLLWKRPLAVSKGFAPFSGWVPHFPPAELLCLLHLWLPSQKCLVLCWRRCALWERIRGDGRDTLHGAGSSHPGWRRGCVVMGGQDLPDEHLCLHRLLRDGEAEGAVWCQWGGERWRMGFGGKLAVISMSSAPCKSQVPGSAAVWGCVCGVIRVSCFSALHILVDDFEYGPFVTFTLKFNWFYIAVSMKETDISVQI